MRPLVLLLLVGALAIAATAVFAPQALGDVALFAGGATVLVSLAAWIDYLIDRRNRRNRPGQW